MIVDAVVEKNYDRETFVSKSGYEVELYTDHWKLSKDVSICLAGFPSGIGSDFGRSFRQVLAVYGETCSGAYTAALFRNFKDYFQSVGDLTVFSPESMIFYRSLLGGNQWMLSMMRAFIRTWLGLGYSGIPVETLTMMQGWRIKGSEKGFAVQSMCPENGPLTDIEMQAVIQSVLECYASGALSLRDTCYPIILAMTGRRPSQISTLKIKDLMCLEGRYFINFPRGKQRYGQWRETFAKYEIVEDLWILLQRRVVEVNLIFAEVCGTEIRKELMPELPLFPALKRYDAAKDLGGQLRGEYLHARVSEIGVVMDKVSRTIKVVSERTGSAINLNPYRFRYTLGTNLAREGRGEYIIAEALDHSDTQNAGVYVKNVPEIVERIDKAVALQLAPLAQAFQGVLVLDETKALRGSDPTSRIGSAVGDVGSCGSFGFCGALAPIACYTCSHFQPWLDGPHELVLDQLIRDRDAVRDATNDLKIASVNDRLILAVGGVVARCNEMRSGIAYV